MSANRIARAVKNSAASIHEPEFDLENFVPYIVTALTRYLHGTMARALAPLEMTIPEWRITVCLSRNDRCTLNDIVRLTWLKQSTLSRAIVRMSKKRLLSRSKKASDCRYRDIRITEHGREMCRQATAAVQAACERELALLRASEREAFIDTMKKLIANIPRPDRISEFEY